MFKEMQRTFCREGRRRSDISIKLFWWVVSFLYSGAPRPS